MSRTDAHSPFHVRIERGEIRRYAVHSCDLVSCPLDAEVGDPRPVGSCWWDYVNAGENWCSCSMCHWHRRPEVRGASTRTRLRDVTRAWNGGDRGVVDAV